jgi:hypothetical protein
MGTVTFEGEPPLVMAGLRLPRPETPPRDPVLNPISQQLA